MDCIHLNGIRAYGYTGFLPEEQVLGQWFEVDLTLWLDLAQAGQSDHLGHTHDYRATIDRVRQLVQTSKFQLIERLASAIAETVLAAGNVDQVRVRLAKPAAPIPEFDGRIAIEITRSAR